MKNKILKIFLCATVASVSITSCEIDRFPETSISDGNYWNNVSDVRLAANYFYTTLPGLSSSEVTKDNWSTFAYPNRGGNSISDGSRVAPTTSGDYSYSNIYRANKLIEKANELITKGGDAAQINRYIAEARFFRAFYYFRMFKRFGGVPLITRTMELGDPDIYKPRATREEIINLIYEDLDFAAEHLPNPDAIDDAGDYGRIPNTGALAFKSRVALFEGTRSKFHHYGDAQKHLQVALSAAKEVMDSGYHALYSTPSVGEEGQVVNEAYYNLFQEKGEGRANRGNIIVRRYGNSDEDNIKSSAIQRWFEGDRIVPTNNFVSQYLMVDGLPIDKSPLFHEPDQNMTHAEFFIGRDPRMDFTIFKRGDEFISSSDYTVPSPSFQRSGYGIRKYANKTFWASQRSYIDRPVLRYAEVLLNYVEAKFELNGSISDADLDLTINALRDRLPEVNIGTETAPNYVAMQHLTNAFVSSNGLSMREEIRRERNIELAFEGHSYWDLIRWKTAEIELPKTLYGSYFFSEYLDYDWSPNVKVNADNYIILQDASLRQFDPAKDYLWPLPTSEIAKNPKIEQNPGW